MWWANRRAMTVHSTLFIRRPPVLGDYPVAERAADSVKERESNLENL